MTTNSSQVIPEIMEDQQKSMVPQMNISMSQKKEEDKPAIVSDEALVGMYGNILKDIEKDKEEVDSVLGKFMDMVMNEGDSSTSSKEALINLIKIKTDLSDKKTKVADLMTRVALKDKDTFPKYMAASQNNTIQIKTNSAQKKTLLETINKAMKQKKED